MSNSILDRQHTGILSRTLLVVVFSLMVTTTLSSCGGGLIGTEDTTDANAASNVDLMPPEAGDTGDSLPGAVPEAEAPSSPDTTPDSTDQLITFGFSNTTPSGLDTASTSIPALKLINLSGFIVTVTTQDDQATGTSISVPALTSSELISVQTGESSVSIGIEGDGAALALIDPLNAAADSITTVIVESTTDTPDLSVLALDTRAVVSADAMAEVRVISTAPVDSGVDPGTTPTLYTFTPSGDESSGVEFTLLPANNDESAGTLYALASAGDYILSSSATGFEPVSVNLAPNAVYTIVITNNPQTPVYVEIDSVAGN